jgi:hypothetical protein
VEQIRDFARRIHELVSVWESAPVTVARVAKAIETTECCDSPQLSGGLSERLALSNGSEGKRRRRQEAELARIIHRVLDLDRFGSRRAARSCGAEGAGWLGWRLQGGGGLDGARSPGGQGGSLAARADSTVLSARLPCQGWVRPGSRLPTMVADPNETGAFRHFPWQAQLHPIRERLPHGFARKPDDRAADLLGRCPPIRQSISADSARWTPRAARGLIVEEPQLSSSASAGLRKRQACLDLRFGYAVIS